MGAESDEGRARPIENSEADEYYQRDASQDPEDSTLHLWIKITQPSAKFASEGNELGIKIVKVTLLLVPQVKALLFLTYRTWWNSFRRSLLSPRRAIGLILFLFVTVGLWFSRVMQVAVVQDPNTALSTLDLNLRLPKNFWPVVFTLEFSIIAFMVLFIPVTMLSLPIAFKKPDVDILFATPISPRLILGGAMFRGQLRGTLYALITLFVRSKSVGRFGGRVDAPSAEVIHDLSTAFFYLVLALMLINMLRAAWAFGMGIFLNRDEERSRRATKVFRVIAGVFAVSSAVLPMSIAFLHVRMSAVGELMQSPILRVVLFPATFASWVANGNIAGRTDLFMIGALSMLALATIGVVFAMRQTPWLYDIAARVAALAVSTRMDDTGLTLSETAAVQGNRAAKKSKLRRWFVRRKATGLYAFVWRECVQQPWGVVIGYSILCLAAIVLPILSMKVSRGAVVGPLIQVVLWPTLFGTRFGPAAGLLAKIDLVKSLPFSSARLLFAAIAIRLVPATIALLLADVVNMIIGSYDFSIGFGAFFALPFLLASNSAGTAVATMVVPDLHDKTQIGLGALVNLLIKIAVNLPWAIVLGVSMIWLPFWAAALLTILPNGLASWVCLRLAGRLYENYNPAE